MSLYFGAFSIAGDLTPSFLPRMEACAASLNKKIYRPVKKGMFASGYTEFHTGNTGPAYASDGELHIIGDVRIYNQRDLLSQLGVRDAEKLGLIKLILTLYQRFGDDCVNLLNGDFSFVIWDSRKRRLFCARDVMGVMPFYYHRISGGDNLVFSSSISCINHVMENNIKPNAAYIAGSLNKIPLANHVKETLVDSVYKLSPGHTLTWQYGKSDIEIKQYWKPCRIKPDSSIDLMSAIQLLREKIINAVESRVSYSNRLAAHVSGGLDSSSVAVIAQDIANKLALPSVALHSWQPGIQGGKAVGEYERINAVARLCKAKVMYHPPKFDDYIDYFHRDLLNQTPSLIEISESPLRPYYREQGVDHVISGFGGDQAVSMKSNLLFSELFLLGQWAELLRQHKSSRLSLRQSIKQTFKPFYEKQLRKIQEVRNEPSGLYLDHARLGDIKPILPHINMPLTQHRLMCHYFQSALFIGRLEAWHDSGIRSEVRYLYPLLDRNVVEWILKLPSHFHSQNGASRYLLRSAMRPILPDVITQNASKSDPSLFRAANKACCKVFKYAENNLKSQQSRDKLKSGTGEWVNVDALLADVQQALKVYQPHQGLYRSGRILRALSLLAWDKI